MKQTLKQKLFYSLYIIGTVCSLNAIAYAGSFIVPDVPAMENMFVGESIELDAMGDSVVSVTTSTPSPKKAVLQYYSTVLANFGWTKLSSDHYKRNTETLRIIFVNTDANGTTVEFNLLSQ